MSRKLLVILDCTAFSFHQEEIKQSCCAIHICFYFCNTERPVLPIVIFCENDLLEGEGAVTTCMSIYVFGGQYDSFLSFGLT